MAKTFFVPLLLALCGLTFPSFAPTPFIMFIVDEQTGLGVPNLRVTNAEGMVRYTGTHGELVVWGRSSPPGSGERFEIDDERSQFVNVAAILRVTPCGRAAVKVHRRAYR